MESILLKAFSFIVVILIGYTLRKISFFKEEDFYVLSNIVVKITLPATIIINFSQSTIKPDMLLLCLAGFAGGLTYIFLGILLGGRDRLAKSFLVLNLSGYNIGNFTMPFTSEFFGANSAVITSLFDTGNAIVCMGAAYSIAAILKNGQKVSIAAITKTLIKSVPFDTYILMLILSILHLSLPAVVLDTATLIANGNAFMAMLMLGVGFRLSGNWSQIRRIVQILAIRYGVAVALFLMIRHVLPIARNTDSFSLCSYSARLQRQLRPLPEISKKMSVSQVL